MNRTRLEEFEAANGRAPVSIAEYHRALATLRTAPSSLTDFDLLIIDHFGGESAAAEARAARERALHPPDPPAPVAAPAAPQQFTTIKRVVRDGQGKIEAVYEEMVPVVTRAPGAPVTAALGAMEPTVSEQIATAVRAAVTAIHAQRDKSRRDAFDDRDRLRVLFDQHLAAAQQRLTDCERKIWAPGTGTEAMSATIGVSGVGHVSPPPQCPRCGTNGLRATATPSQRAFAAHLRRDLQFPTGRRRSHREMRRR